MDFIPPVAAVDGEQPSGEPAAAPAEQNPGPVAAQQPPVAGNPAAVPVAPAADGGFLPPPSNGGVAAEFNMANMPLWMKASLFAGSMAVLWYMFIYRR